MSVCMSACHGPPQPEILHSRLATNMPPDPQLASLEHQLQLQHRVAVQPVTPVLGLSGYVVLRSVWQLWTGPAAATAPRPPAEASRAGRCSPHVLSPTGL